MNKFESSHKVLPLFSALLLSVFLAACGGGDRSPILGLDGLPGLVPTGPVQDTTRPSVTLTLPATTAPGPTLGVPANTAISAIFTEEMAPATLNATSFTVTCSAPCVSPAGSVSYAAGTQTAVFKPAAALTVGATYTVTITTGATDLAGNALAGNQAPLPAASNYVWMFTTAAPVAQANVTVLSSNPVVAAAGRVSQHDGQRNLRCTLRLEDGSRNR